MKKQKPDTVALIAITATMIYGIFGLTSNISLINKAETQNIRLKDEIALIRNENESLSELIENSDSPSAKEALARERFGLVKPGEIMFIDKK